MASSVKSKTTSENNGPIPLVPLDREHFSKSLAEAISKIREGSATVTSFVAVLEQLNQFWQAELVREKLEASPNLDPLYIA